jgi:hypothetical protein
MGQNLRGWKTFRSFTNGRVRSASRVGSTSKPTHEGQHRETDIIISRTIYLISLQPQKLIYYVVHLHLLTTMIYQPKFAIAVLAWTHSTNCTKIRPLRAVLKTLFIYFRLRRHLKRPAHSVINVSNGKHNAASLHHNFPSSSYFLSPLPFCLFFFNIFYLIFFPLLPYLLQSGKVFHFLYF